MHPRVEKFPKPDPDYRRFLAAVRRQNTSRVPLIELAVHPEVVAVLLGESASSAPAHTSAEAAGRLVRVLHRLGYDVAKASAEIPFDLQWVAGRDKSNLSGSDRAWQDQHSGPVQTAEDCAAYPWPVQEKVNFGPVETAAAQLPDGMKLIGFSGGVLEYATYLMGLERFMLGVYDAPELVEEVIRRVGETIYGVFEAYCQMADICAIWIGDDMGSKNGLLVSPELLKTYVLPWHTRFAELAHRYDKPFLLHCCGKTESIMPAIVDDVGIDAKHSFEDGIEPVEKFLDKWGSKIGVMGGVDVNLLSIGTEAQIQTRVMQILEHAAPSGGYVCGSGNSIPNYVSSDNYLTMVETATRFNGLM